MITHNSNTIRFTESILEKKLQIELLSIELDNGVSKLMGKGFVCQGDDGALILKFFADHIRDLTSRLKDMCDRVNNSNTEGQLVKKTEYYHLKGYDSNGVLYTCQRVYSYRPNEGYTVFRIIDKLTCNRSLSDSRIVCVGKYKIPHSDQIANNIYGEKLSYTTPTNIFKLNISKDIVLRISSYSNYLDILISHNSTIDFDNIENIISSINFVLGVDLEPIYSNIKQSELHIYPRPLFYKTKSTFPAPLSLGRSYGSNYFENHRHLFRCYYEFLSKSLDRELQLIEKKIWSAGQSYPYILAVTLTAQIERIGKEYFHDYYKPNLDFNDTIDAAMSMLSESGSFGEDEVKRLNDILRNKKVANPPKKSQLGIKVILNELLTRNKISSKSFIDGWESLRGSVAHGDNIGGVNGIDGECKIIQYTQININLYYEIVFALIGYTGVYSFKAKDLDNNKLNFYLGFNLGGLGLSNGDKLYYQNKEYIIVDANKNLLCEGSKRGDKINLQVILNGVIRTYTDFCPLASIKHADKSLAEIIETI